VNLIKTQSQVPNGDYLVIGGDLNTDNRNEACLATFSQLVRTSGPYPADHNGNGNTNASRGKPYDWVLPGNSLATYSTPLVVGGSTYANGIVFDSRIFTPISSVPPVLASDSGAVNMQHMAVMRAFLIPTNDAPLIAGPAEVPVTLSHNNHPQAFSLALSATDADADPLQWSISSPASHGSAAVLPPASGGNASFSYQPAGGYTGADAFTVRVSDGKGGTDEVTVTLNVIPASAYDRWTFEEFAPLDPAGELTVWGGDNDPDGDGYTNLSEFAHGLDPRVADAAPNLMSCALVAGRIELSYKIRMDGGQPALDYGVLSARSLDGPWAILPVEAYTVTGEVAAGPGFMLRTIRLSGELEETMRFFRLKMSR